MTRTSARPPGHEEQLELLRDLIAIESHRDAVEREADVGRHLVGWFGRRGIDAQLDPVDGARANVIARIPGRGGPSLMFNGHLDTVPAGDMPDAFTPRVDDAGRLWGRGACDMKGAIAAMCCAVASMAAARDRLAGDLLFVGTVDEESGSLGVKAAVDAGLAADYAVVGEPTSLRVAIAHKGSCFVRVRLTGRGAHGSCPERGVNAASYAARIVGALEDELRPRLAGRRHPMLGTSTVNVGRICGGTQPNIVAETCEIDIDRRYLPDESDPLAEVRALVADVCDRAERLTYEVREMTMTSRVPHVPLETPADARLVEAAAAACREAGLPSEPVGVTYWSDGGHLAASGIETIVLGPGDIAHAHGPREHVAIRDVAVAGSLYRRIAETLLL